MTSGPDLSTDAAPVPAQPGPPVLGERVETPAAKRLRDKLTADAMLAAVRAMHPGARAGSFVAQWWDGTALVPALHVEVDGRRLRVVTAPAGEVLLLPRSSWAARRRLRRVRRPGSQPVDARPHVGTTPGGLPRTALLYEVTDRRPRIGRPGPRMPIRVAGAVDYRACTNYGCGAVLPLPAAGPDPPCPRCGRR